MGAGLQALFSLKMNNHIFKKNGKLGSPLLEIINLIEDKKVNVFPIKFKKCFD